MILDDQSVLHYIIKTEPLASQYIISNIRSYKNPQNYFSNKIKISKILTISKNEQ